MIEEALNLEVVGDSAKAQGTAWIFLKSGDVTEIDEDVRTIGTLSVIGTPSSSISDKVQSVQRAKDWWRAYAPQNMPLRKQNVFMTDEAREHLSEVERFSYDGGAALALALDQGLSHAAVNGRALDLRAALQEGVRFTGLFAKYSRAGTHVMHSSQTNFLGSTTGTPTWNGGNNQVTLWNNKGSPAGDNMQVSQPCNCSSGLRQAA